MNETTSAGNGRSQARLIRRRLFWLLFKVFGAVAATALVLLLGLITIMLGGPRDEEATFPPEQLAIVETYYLARGDWQGVTELWRRPPDNSPDAWQQLVLLDKNGRVLAGAVPLGAAYEVAVGEVPFNVLVAGRMVGRLILTQPAEFTAVVCVVRRRTVRW